MNYSENIIFLRNKKNLSQEELANKINISKNKIICWEKGLLVPTFYEAKKLALFFNVSIENILEEENCQDKVEDNINLIKNTSKEVKIASIIIILISYALVFVFFFADILADVFKQYILLLGFKYGLTTNQDNTIYQALTLFIFLCYLFMISALVFFIFYYLKFTYSKFQRRYYLRLILISLIFIFANLIMIILYNFNDIKLNFFLVYILALLFSFSILSIIEKVIIVFNKSSLLVENNIIIRKINILYIISSSVLLISLIILFICNSTSIKNFILNYYICTLSFFSLSFIYYLIKFIAIKIIEKNKNI